MLGIIIILILLIVWIIAGNYFYNSIFNRKTATLKYLDIFSKKEKKMMGNHTKEDYNYLNKKNVIEEVNIKSFDNTKLYSRLIKNDGNKWVIFIHGYLDKASKYFPIVKYYYDLGFNVLLLDVRGHGNSDGKYLTMGEYESKDVKSWIDFIKSKEKNPKIVIHGVSMGAFTTLLSSKYVTKDVKLLISEGSYTSIKEILTHQVADQVGIFAKPAYMMGSFITKLRTRANINDASAVDALKNNEVPVVFIHSIKDTVIPEYMVDQLYNANKGSKEKYLLEGTHSLLSFVNKDKYYNIIKENIKKYVK